MPCPIISHSSQKHETSSTELSKKTSGDSAVGKQREDYPERLSLSARPGGENGPLVHGMGEEKGRATEEVILNLLLSDDLTKYQRARDLISELLTRHGGEYVLRIGQQSSCFSLHEEHSSDTTDGWVGIPLTEIELDCFKDRIDRTVEELDAKASVLFETREDPPRISFLLRFPSPDTSRTPEVRCALIGNVDSGKSTTLGVLTHGALDDGRGSARISLFRHKCEIETGRTSSVTMHILGFDPSGVPILPKETMVSGTNIIRREKLSDEQKVTEAAKVVSFVDLAGHQRYLKTTVYGLTSCDASFVILTVGANAGLIGMSMEHLIAARALGLPIVVCITKIDMTPENVASETVAQLVNILRSKNFEKIPVFVNSIEKSIELAIAFGKNRKLCPIFRISNVTGEGLSHMRTFLNLSPSRETNDSLPENPKEFWVTEVFSVPYVGIVVDGLVHSGTVRKGDAVLFGPDDSGKYKPATIINIQRYSAEVTRAVSGRQVSLALKLDAKTNREYLGTSLPVRKGMVLTSKSDSPPRPIRQFEGKILVLHHHTTMKVNYEAVLHCGAVRQTVKIIGMDHPDGVLRSRDKATVQLEFMSRPEVIKKGMKFFFRGSSMLAFGLVTQLL